MRKTITSKAEPILRQTKPATLFKPSQVCKICPNKSNKGYYSILSVPQTNDKDNIHHSTTTTQEHGTITSTTSATRKLFPTASYLLPHSLARTMDNGLHHFLPRGYAVGSVPTTYFDYTKWSVGAAIASSAAMVLSTQSLLYAVGLGAGAIPTAAALNWVLKDGLGQLGGVLFASLVNNRFDSDPKRWRVVAAASLDGAVFLQALTPLAPGMFLPMAALANVGMNISWLAASASRAGIHLSFSSSRSGTNLADITAKAGSQTTFASTLGMALGVGISPFVGSSPELIVPTLVTISAIHLGCTLRSLHHVTLNTLNLQRAEIVAFDFVERVKKKEVNETEEMYNEDTGDITIEYDNIDGGVLSIEEVSKEEVVIGPYGYHLRSGFHPSLPYQYNKSNGNSSLTINDDIEKYININTMSEKDMKQIQQNLKVKKYHVCIGTIDEMINIHKNESNDTNLTIGLLVEEDASSKDTLLGHLHSAKIRQLLSTGEILNNEMNAVEFHVSEWISKYGNDYFENLSNQGWNADNLFLEEDTSRRVKID
jgi:hypothetical protein